ncbi:putative late L2 protein [Rhinolophus ferrumequinum papillomavirus 1]|uniref:Minor capsid protein L2 n=1 Tax=Rhinolophus ferrumequinum papillomavirus 1 TaxID=1464074 RepID=W8EAB7_9PAPI|nr:putative late L2 protein [Rhinolophus ferrumequinum papillomavirus 1]AHJ81406.1 putative late L2 protein [Rhinolophus ferrumequinum papillomavirus 1]
MIRIRRKRDSVQNIYRTCKLFNTCPEDVKNKVEQNTLADKLLKYGSGAVYLGSLGIGTGSGAGSQTLGGVAIGGRGGSSFRPSIPISTLGPRELVPVDTLEPGLVGPSDPSVIQLEDIPTATTEVVVEVHPEPPGATEFPTDPSLPRPPTVDEGLTPEITVVGGPEDTAVIQITPQPSVPGIVSRTQYTNPSFEVTVHTPGAGELSSGDSIVVYGGGGEVFGDDIPMVEFVRPDPRGARAQYEETDFSTSTPETVPARRRPALSNRRRFEQVEVTDRGFLNRPASLVTFENTFENPAFEDDVTLIFERDVDAVLQAPHRDFTDIASLSRPEYTRAPSGRVRVSRVGQKASIRTRSGITIGSRTHFYHDLSSIRPEESIPMVTFAEQSGESTIVQPLAESGFGSTQHASVFADPELDVVFLDSDPITEDSMLDEYEDIGSSAQLVIHNEGEDFEFIDSVSHVPARRPSLFPEAVSTKGVHVVYPESNHGTGPVYPNDTPAVYIDPFSADYYLHPSLRLKRRRRRGQFVYVY